MQDQGALACPSRSQAIDKAQSPCSWMSRFDAVSSAIATEDDSGANQGTAASYAAVFSLTRNKAAREKRSSGRKRTSSVGAQGQRAMSRFRLQHAMRTRTDFCCARLPLMA
jgi:hypothetical protein